MHVIAAFRKRVDLTAYPWFHWKCLHLNWRHRVYLPRLTFLSHFVLCLACRASVFCLG
jgi:hypothetical protein